MNVLVIAPHPDDETIGCGGTLCKHVKYGDRITAVFLTSGELGLKHLPREKARAIREREAKAAAQILGISELKFLRCSDWVLCDEIKKAAELLVPVLKSARPAMIYLPHPLDAHPDHEAALPVLKAALMRTRIVRPTLRFYESWSPLSSFDVVQDVSSFMNRKVRALRAHKSQLKDFDYERAIVGLNQYRGALAAKCKFAEVFAESNTETHSSILKKAKA